MCIVRFVFLLGAVPSLNNLPSLVTKVYLYLKHSFVSPEEKVTNMSGLIRSFIHSQMAVAPFVSVAVANKSYRNVLRKKKVYN